jgi:hypothetical protein
VAKRELPGPISIRSSAKGAETDQLPRQSPRGPVLKSNANKADTVDDETADNFAGVILDLPKARL